MICKNNNAEANISTCNRICKEHDTRQVCPDHNHDIAKKFGRVLEPNCEKAFNNKSLICENCSEFTKKCQKILNASQLLNGENSSYTEFSGYCAVVPPNYITIDLGELRRVSIIQFLLWDNRGNDKEECCETGNFYRLLTSDYIEGIHYDSANNLIQENEDQGAIRWKVVYDSLRIGQCGWQVFKFKVPESLRYIRLHLISNSDRIASKIVGLEVYEKPLIGYEYPFLPTFVKVIENDENEHNSNLNNNDDLTDTNTISRLSKHISSLLNDKYKRDKIYGSYKLAQRVQLLNDELNLVAKEAEIYESRLKPVKEKMFSKIKRQFHIQKAIAISSIVLLVITVVWEIVKNIYK